jgi:hypothetical protein
MRKMYFNHSFYSNNCTELNKTFNPVEAGFILPQDSISSAQDSISAQDPVHNSQIKAIVVPHAGYIYSGFTANQVYKIAGNQNFERVIVIGPSHRIYFKNASITLEDYYETPCGNLEIDVQYSKELIKNFNFLSDIKEAQKEHSTETQMPFIKHYFDGAKVIEIIYGDINCQKLSKLIEYIINNDKNLIVISTDLSHFHNLKEANSIDKICIESFVKFEIEDLDKGCEACGIKGLRALINVSKNKNFKANLIDYRTSADTSKNKSEVVGYMSGVISK